MIYLWILKTKYLYIIAMATDACWVGHLWNQAFLCRTMYFCVEPGFLCRTSVIIWYTNCLCTSIYNDIYKYSLANKMHLGENNKTTQYIIQYPGRKKKEKNQKECIHLQCVHSFIVKTIFPQLCDEFIELAKMTHAYSVVWWFMCDQNTR